MENSTDIQHLIDDGDEVVLAQLKLRRVKLKLELERVEAAIKAFEPVNINSLNDLDLLSYDPSLHPLIKGDGMRRPRTSLYDADMKFEDKIIWALGKLQRATANEIASYLVRFDEGAMNKTRFLTGVVYNASRMYKTGKINALKKGNKNYYKLKD